MNRLKEIRLRKGISQKELADMSENSPLTISRLERSERRINEENSINIARALGVQPGELMPIITDGSVPSNTSLSDMHISVLVHSLKLFFQVHTNFEINECENLALAAVRLYQLGLNGLNSQEFFSEETLASNLATMTRKASDRSI